ncbi:UDP-2,3-diacylglucosamine diphosphatase [Sansalvadorimonas sp. 2012CJ34-2]|uniref:UDP-2,3-diacylglucosamine hydrolase n=1 Tax=Parendozoicomonas callyspongiae TaxID=2942213 RepID=A0ABT0PBF9_9GAMM|nr:UDP-2,3-diacylglucosamine diphosphatase [Sansalvadorimonas sp. 2012CJ34-2]MCL6268719.1 UDP-2,3-diacylglucosamine diphosphatase [Sansalvadorimonas sp. 2012CJ34-2]
MRSLFISDLHLTPGRPDITRAFLRFLEQDAPTARQLYILGDFFEYWIGDDVMDEFHLQIAGALRRLSEHGVSISFMHGNRDFLVGERFCQLAGCTALPDPSVILLAKEPVVLMHGDSLCTLDTSYIRFRKVVRNPLIQKLFLSFPKRMRRKLADRLREKSMSAAREKTEPSMDVTPEAVTDALTQYQSKTLIHGHTHKPAIHDLEDGQQRIVLGDWDTYGWVLEHNPNGFDLKKFTI